MLRRDRGGRFSSHKVYGCKRKVWKYHNLPFVHHSTASALEKKLIHISNAYKQDSDSA